MKYILLTMLTAVFCVEATIMDNDLEKNPESNFASSLANFQEKGGTLILLEGDAAPYRLSKGDIVFPSCSGANNRSQTLWNLLRIYEPHITVMLPHATRYGFDPYNNSVNWHRANHIPYSDDEFVLWAGINKARKLGWSLFENWLPRLEATKEELSLIWHYYTDHYYNPKLPKGPKRIYITFAQNVHVHLFRLSQTNESLSDVVLVGFPLPDAIAAPYPEWNTYPRSKEAYIQLAALIMKYLDFSELEEALQESDTSSFVLTH